MAEGEQWNVRICLAGSAPTVSTLSTDKEVAIAAGFNLRLDTRRGALQCYDTDPAHPWLSIGHPEPCSNAHFDLDLRNLPAGFAAAAAVAATSSKKKSKKRAAEGEHVDAPMAKKAKTPQVAPAAAGTELETPPKKKRPPSTKNNHKKTASASTTTPANASAAQNTLEALYREIDILDS